MPREALCNDEIINGLKNDIIEAMKQGKTEFKAVKASKYYDKAHDLEILAAICEREREA